MPRETSLKSRRGRPLDPDSFRGWCRKLVDDPVLRRLAKKAIAGQLEKGIVEGYSKFAEHGYGRPPAEYTPVLVNVNLAVVNALSQLPDEALIRYAETGELKASEWKMLNANGSGR